MSYISPSKEGGKMSAPNHRIKDYRIIDLPSFEEATEAPRSIAGLYFYQILDCLVDLAYKVSADFRKRPQLYRDLGEHHVEKHEEAGVHKGIALTLAELNAKYGTEINYLDNDQRNEIYLPIFGNWEGPVLASMPTSNNYDCFPQLRDDLIKAATAFAERAEDSHVDQMLRAGVLTALTPFRDYLVWVQGDSANLSKEVLFELTEKTCYPILRNKAIAAVFGITKRVSESDSYPYATGPAEDALIEEVSSKLAWVDNSQTWITRCRISKLQRAALRGAEAIATAVDFEETKETVERHEHLELLIAKLYTWGTALMSLKDATNPAPMTMAAKASEPQTQQPVAMPSTSSTKSPIGYAR
jgi:hypothetical protein